MQCWWPYKIVIAVAQEINIYSLTFKYPPWNLGNKQMAPTKQARVSFVLNLNEPGTEAQTYNLNI